MSPFNPFNTAAVILIMLQYFSHWEESAVLSNVDAPQSGGPSPAEQHPANAVCCVWVVKDPLQANLYLCIVDRQRASGTEIMHAGNGFSFNRV